LEIYKYEKWAEKTLPDFKKGEKIKITRDSLKLEKS
jgi:hypothetical protein